MEWEEKRERRKEPKGAASLSSKQQPAASSSNKRSGRTKWRRRESTRYGDCSSVLAVQKVVKSAISPVASLAWLA